MNDLLQSRPQVVVGRNMPVLISLHSSSPKAPSAMVHFLTITIVQQISHLDLNFNYYIVIHLNISITAIM